MAYIEDDIKGRIREELGALAGLVKLAFFKDDSEGGSCGPMEGIVREVAALSSRIELRVFDRVLDADKAGEYGVDKVPALVLEGPSGSRVRFYGLVAGYEFPVLLEALKDAAAGKADLGAQARRTLGGVSGPVRIQVFVTSTCPHCPGVVRSAHRMAVECENVTADMVDAQAFPDLAERCGVRGVPMVVVNGKAGSSGSVPDHVLAETVVSLAGRN